MRYILSKPGLSIPGRKLILKYASEQSPFRSELYNSEQLLRHCQVIADKHKLVQGCTISDLVRRLTDNEKALLEVQSLLDQVTQTDKQAVQNREWKTNFYFILDQVRKVKGLMRDIDSDLPRIQHKFIYGWPRIYDIAIEVISHTNAQLSDKNLISFIKAYQSISNLQTGELKAIPAIIKLALIENLRRIAVRFAAEKIEQHYANYWVNKMLAQGKNEPEHVIGIIEELFRSGPVLKSVFITEIIQRLQVKGEPDRQLPLAWVEKRLLERGLSIDEVLQSVKEEQMADRVSMRNSISSLRMLDTANWQAYVDECSVIEPVLAKDESGVYSKMDFYTRDSYRTEVGKLARQANLSEMEVACQAVSLSKNGGGELQNNYPFTHVGYYLIGVGRKEMERSLGLHSFSRFKWREIVNKHPLWTYLGGIAGTTVLLMICLFPQILKANLATGWLLITGPLLLLSITQLAKIIVESIMGLITKSTLMPRLDFSEGIPPEYRTLVVIPALLTSKEEIDQLVRALEVQFLANRYDNLHFGLLTDFMDAKSRTLPDDDQLLQYVKQQIEELSTRYNGLENDTFFLFHRPRKYNDKDRLWMGYERKRGKLMDLNALLRGMEKENFSVIIGKQALFPSIKYIITLDSDTLLPRETAWKMIGSLAHPLNYAVYDEIKGRVVKGYGILQPRIRMDMRAANKSLYQQISGSGPDIDPYTYATPDIYQDLFGEGSFIGKGIYDVDIAIKTLYKRFPDNRILSHDLLEGCYARSGLLSDVTLYEPPSNVITDLKRRHRWTRGDWQILPWILPRVPKFDRSGAKNPLSALSRWKIFDNLRNSLIPVSCFLLFLAGFTVLQDPLFWSLYLMAVLIFPAFTIFTIKLLKKPAKILSWVHWQNCALEAKDRFTLNLYTASYFPYEVYYTSDAMIRAGWRILISHKKMLEWEPSSSVKNNKVYTVFGLYRFMWPAPVIGLVMFVYLAIYQPAVMVMGEGFLLTLWIVSPVITWQISRPGKAPTSGLETRQNLFLRKLARKTWAYFEDFINADSNWLPPDHYQEYPNGKVADYTSPTNMGLALLSNLAASDFGYITTSRFIEKTGKLINAMAQLERYKGHFYNWYNIRTLEPTMRYISTVDSGNLAGHLLTMRQGILMIPGQRIINPNTFKALADVYTIISENGNPSYLPDQHKEGLACITNFLPETLEEVKTLVQRLKGRIAPLMASMPVQPEVDDLYWWKALDEQCNDIINELKIVAPWLWLAPPPGKYADLLPRHIPTLTELAAMKHFIVSGEKIKQCKNDNSFEEEWLFEFRQCVEQAGRVAGERIDNLKQLARQCSDFADVQYDFLYKPSELLLSIGYHVDSGCQDPDNYDVLASEARLGTFIGICQDKLPIKSWFAQGRTLVKADQTYTLLSANGTMFEYLMPLLVMPVFENTLLDNACRAAVHKQMAYGKKHGIPWGVSESGYSTMDENLNYQYKVYGIPELSLKRDHAANDKVVAPYATALALMVTPDEACINLERLCREGLEGRYGLYEAIDYTRSRLPRGHSKSIVRSYMVHHQGMSFLSFANILLDKIMQHRFMSDARLESALLLLQERVPKDHAICLPKAVKLNTASDARIESDTGNMLIPGTESTEVQLLSNGRYHVMVTGLGKGYSKWKDMVITEGLKDNTGGVFCYVRDLEKDVYISTTCQTSGDNNCSHESLFSVGAAEFYMHSDDLEMHTQLVVSSDEDMEIRRLTIHNKTSKQKHIELVSFTKLAMNSLYKEIADEQNAILYATQTAIASDKFTYMFHSMNLYHKNSVSVHYRTDHLKYAITKNKMQAGTAVKKKAASDSVSSITYELTLKPGETTTADVCIGVGEDRKSCWELLQRCHNKEYSDTLIKQSHVYSRAILDQLNITEEDAHLFRRMAGRVIFSDNTFFHLSKEPVVLLRIKHTNDIEVILKVVQMHAYWRLKGMPVTLLIWNEDRGCYSDFLQKLIIELIANGVGADSLNHLHGGIHVKAVGAISEDKDNSLLQTASLVISADKWPASVDANYDHVLTEEETMIA